MKIASPEDIVRRTAVRALGGFRDRTLQIFGIRQKKSKVVPARLPGVVYTETPRIERFVFVCGLHRSGTTMLERMLTSRFEVSCLRARTPESEGQHMQSVYGVDRDFGGPGGFAFSRSMYAELDALLRDPEACRRQILADWSRFVVGNDTTLLEKSPPNLTKIDWLRQVFPGSRFVILTRDPRAATGATQKWSKTPLSRLMQHWDRAHAKALADFREEDCTILRYEDLCETPDAEIARVADFLELVPRPVVAETEERHRAMVNSNAQYFGLHGDKRYGPGTWNRFGYDI